MRKTKPSKLKKKGAIELGMNTIIIVVIGITLLSLALVWIRDMMGEGGLGGLTKGALGEAESAIGEIYKGTTEDLAVSPESLSVKPGKTGKVKMIFSNLEETDYTNVNFKITAAASGDQKVSCVFTTTLKDEAGPYDEIPSGRMKRLQILVQVDKDSPLGTAVCTVTAPGTVDTEKSIIVTVGE